MNQIKFFIRKLEWVLKYYLFILKRKFDSDKWIIILKKFIFGMLSTWEYLSLDVYQIAGSSLVFKSLILITIFIHFQYIKHTEFDAYYVQILAY